MTLIAEEELKQMNDDEVFEKDYDILESEDNGRELIKVTSRVEVSRIHAKEFFKAKGCNGARIMYKTILWGIAFPSRNIHSTLTTTTSSRAIPSTTGHSTTLKTCVKESCNHVDYRRKGELPWRTGSVRRFLILTTRHRSKTSRRRFELPNNGLYNAY
jgi:hypothetical protein